MTTPVSPEDAYKYLTVSYGEKDKVKKLNDDAVGYDGATKKWYIKKSHSEF